MSIAKRLPFKNVEIIDSRFDRCKIGYLLHNNYKALFIKPNLSKGLERILNGSLRSNLDLSANSSLLIVIKNLWLRQPLERKESNPRDECISKMELYLKTDTAFYPLFRIDSVYRHQSLLTDSAGAILMMPFIRCITRLQNLEFDNIKTLRKPSWSDIEKYNLQRFELPILKTAPQKGIYISFKDFLNNRIDRTPFETDMVGLTDQLYIIERNEKKLLTEFWGFCDGEKLYVNSRFHFYVLVKTGNSFEFWGDPQVVQHSYRPGFYANNTSPTSLASGLANYGINSLMLSKKDMKRPFQINMENGEVY